MFHVDPGIEGRKLLGAEMSEIASILGFLYTDFDRKNAVFGQRLFQCITSLKQCACHYTSRNFQKA